MSFIYSPNMNLNIPTVGQEPGPQYAFDVNTSLTLVDQHDHSPGRGVQINPAGININATLDMQNNILNNAKTVVFDAQSSISSLQTLYVAPGTETPPINDLFFNDGAGNVVQLTANGTVNASIASLPGESYAAGTFFWKQGTGSTTPANFDIGSITIRPNLALTANGVILGPNAAIASQYNVQLPLPTASTNIMSLDSSGNMAALINVDNATIQLSSNILSVKNNGITTTQIANGAVTANKLANIANTSTFTSNNTFTVPAGVTSLDISASGGGGGGGGSGAASLGAQARGGSGGGGGSAAWVLNRVTAVTPGDVITMVVGAAGVGGIQATNGTNGGDTTVTNTTTSTLLINAVGGGFGGGGGNSSGSFAAGSAGVGAFANKISAAGGAGQVGTSGSAPYPGAGIAGQASPYGGGGVGGTTFNPGTSSSGGGGGGGGGAGYGNGGNGGNSSGNGGNDAGLPGSAGTGFGSGGGGASGAYNQAVGASGGNGSSGFVTITWYGHT